MQAMVIGTDGTRLLRSEAMPRKDWIRFSALAALWGASYLFIKVALEDDLSPAMIVFARTAVAALVLLPFAGRAGALAGLRERIWPVAVLALLQIAAPFLLITAGEQHLSSSLTGILVATATRSACMARGSSGWFSESPASSSSSGLMREAAVQRSSEA